MIEVSFIFEEVAVDAPAGMREYPSSFGCQRCGNYAMPWVEDEDRGRPGCRVWVCWVCDRMFAVRLRSPDGGV